MATRTFTTAGVNNLWSNAANWDTGVPVNTDTAVIPLGQDAEFDVDQSGFAAGVTVQIAGTLHASTTAGAYILKMQANMTGAGTLRAGTSGTPYPTNCTFTIQRGGFTITVTNLDINCSEPTTKYIRLSGVEAAGQTVLSVDTDVTGEAAYWADGALLRICDVNFGNDNEEYTIAAGGVAAATITVTAGLADQKETGALVVLISRNVKITHTAATGNVITGATGGRLFAEVRNGAAVTAVSTTVGGTFSGLSTTLQNCESVTFSGCIAGCTNGFNAGMSNTLLAASLVAGTNISFNGSRSFVCQGLISGNAATFTNCGGMLVYGDVVYNATGFSTGTAAKLIGATLTNTTDISGETNLYAFNTLFGGTTEFASYTGTTVGIASFSESIDHDQTANAYKAWTKGGIVTSNTLVVYGTRPRSFQHACESASYYVFRNYSVTVEAGGGLVVQCYVRKDALMAYLPRVWILLPGVEPFISGSPDYEDIMTDSVDTWEELNLVYANGGTSPVTVTVRTLAKNAANNVYFDPIITTLAPETYDVYNTLLGYVDTIESRLPAALVGGRMDSSVGVMAANVLTAAAIATDAIDADALAADAVAEIQAGLSTLTAAQVNAEVVDALTIDTYAEPVAVPAATSSLATKIGWLFTLARNKITQTAAIQTLRNDGDGGNIGTAPVSDDGATATRGKWS